MLSNKEAVSVLVPIFKSLDQPRPIILLGAGASFRSGIPTAGEAVKRIARLVYSEQILRAVRPPERINAGVAGPAGVQLADVVRRTGDQRFSRHLLCPGDRH